MIPIRYFLILFFMLLVSSCKTNFKDELAFSDVWIRYSPTGPYAAYFTLQNNSRHNIVLQQVISSRFACIEFHETKIGNDGMATMRPLKSAIVNANTSLSFVPMGKHLMLFQPITDLTLGDQINFTFHFDNDQSITTSATVSRQNTNH
ncbi:MAG: copper chaperone PCu(A)C [Gammaproteobacteria bacterium]|nr:copper chaperone PCu(A)C [Gammaproteobacteria bacterium]